MNLPEDEFILQYLHKKFDRQGSANLKRKTIKTFDECSFGIKKVLIFPDKELQETQYPQLLSKRLDFKITLNIKRFTYDV